MKPDHLVLRRHCDQLIERRFRLAPLTGTHQLECRDVGFQHRVASGRFEYGNGLLLPFKDKVADRAKDDARTPFHRGAADTDSRPEVLVDAFQPCRDVHRVAQHRVIVPDVPAEIPHGGDTGIDADACDTEKDAFVRLPLDEFLRKLIHGKRTSHGQGGVIRLVGRRPPKRHHSIADELVNGALTVMNQVAHAIQVLVEGCNQDGRLRRLRQVRKSGYVRKDERHFAALATQAKLGWIGDQLIHYRRRDVVPQHVADEPLLFPVPVSRVPDADAQTCEEAQCRQYERYQRPGREWLARWAAIRKDDAGARPERHDHGDNGSQSSSRGDFHESQSTANARHRQCHNNRQPDGTRIQPAAIDQLCHRVRVHEGAGGHSFAANQVGRERRAVLVRPGDIRADDHHLFLRADRA